MNSWIFANSSYIWFSRFSWKWPFQNPIWVFTLVIIVIFHQKWQFRLKNEKFLGIHPKHIFYFASPVPKIIITDTQNDHFNPDDQNDYFFLISVNFMTSWWFKNIRLFLYLAFFKFRWPADPLRTMDNTIYIRCRARYKY